MDIIFNKIDIIVIYVVNYLRNPAKSVNKDVVVTYMYLLDDDDVI